MKFCDFDPKHAQVSSGYFITIFFYTRVKDEEINQHVAKQTERKWLLGTEQTFHDQITIHIAMTTSCTNHNLLIGNKGGSGANPIHFFVV